MKRIVDKPIQISALSASGGKSHFEIEVKVALKGKAEALRVEEWLYGQHYVFDKETLIVDFVEPSKSVTSRVRFEETQGDDSDELVCTIGKKSHPIAGKLEDFVRQETEPHVDALVALMMLLKAIKANKNEPIPYYTKKRRYFKGPVGKHEATIAIDKPKGLLKKFTRRFMEVEIQLDLNSTEKEVAAVVKAINAFLLRVLGEYREPEISYRKMVKETWESRGMLKKLCSRK